MIAVVTVPQPWAPPLEAKIALRNEPRQQRLRALVDTNIDFVARVLQNLGTPTADVDDAVQRTFMVLADRLDDVRPGAERSFLYQTAANVAAHARRSLARRREVSSEQTTERSDLVDTPDVLADRQRARGLLDRILEALGEELREVFVLYELEELTMVEIAAALGIPSGTVASRLRRARERFRAEVARLHEPKGEEESA
ncbi:MAG: sigma-70 family RNA polymerase sigma factor [Polyangiaceae bacterium]|nr:sigma-70 family RNA polymerase sigma factor [Polyangiaceae bacterium]